MDASAYKPFFDCMMHFTENKWNTDKLNSQDRFTYSHLARAHAICKNECPDEMDQFYSNLKQTLEDDTTKEWAIAAYKKFQEPDVGKMTVIERCAR